MFQVAAFLRLFEKPEERGGYALSKREHICPECGYRTHRDHAAAEMVLLRGLELVSTPGLGGTETRCALPLDFEIQGRSATTMQSIYRGRG